MRICTFWGLVGLVTAWTWTPQAAHAEDAVTPSGPRELALGGAGRAQASGAQVAFFNPAGGSSAGELSLEAGYSYRALFGAGTYAAVCDTSSPVQGCFHYTYLSDGPGNGRVHSGGLTLAYPFTPNIYLGQNAKYVDVNALGNVAGEAGFVWDLAFTARFSELVVVSAVAKNLVTAKLPDESTYFSRQFAGSLSAAPSRNLVGTFDVNWNSGADAVQFGGGVEFFWSRGLQQGIPIRAGGFRDQGTNATYVSGGLGFATMKMAIDVGARYALSGPSKAADKAWEFALSVRLFVQRGGANGDFVRAAK